jgi:hypothetical protein
VSVALCFFRLVPVFDISVALIVLSVLSRRLNGATKFSDRFPTWRNGFCYGKINDGVKYINGSGAMTKAARRR